MLRPRSAAAISTRERFSISRGRPAGASRRSSSAPSRRDCSPGRRPGRQRAFRFLTNPVGGLFAAPKSSQPFRSDQQLALARRRYDAAAGAGFLRVFTFEADTDVSMSWFLRCDAMRALDRLPDPPRRAPISSGPARPRPRSRPARGNRWTQRPSWHGWAALRVRGRPAEPAAAEPDADAAGASPRRCARNPARKLLGPRRGDGAAALRSEASPRGRRHAAIAAPAPRPRRRRPGRGRAPAGARGWSAAGSRAPAPPRG